MINREDSIQAKTILILTEYQLPVPARKWLIGKISNGFDAGGVLTTAPDGCLDRDDTTRLLDLIQDPTNALWVINHAPKSHLTSADHDRLNEIVNQKETQ